MADNLDPDVVAQFQEAMRQATEAAQAMPAAMAGIVDAINKAQTTIKTNTKATQDDTKAVGDNTDATEENTAMKEAEAEAAKKLKEALALQDAAYKQTKQAIIGFGEALLSGKVGFDKYGKAMQSAGDAALDFGKSLGGLGTVLGYIVKGATMVGQAFAKQADDVLKATDDLSKIGTAGTFSAEQVRKMGTSLGLASDQLDKFVKPVKSLGSSLISLGGNAADGVKKFQELAQVTSDQRQAYQRLGISQEELIQNTADYVNLQTQQGRQITEQMKRDGSLKVAAREYTDNLLELAALTGKDIEAVKKKNELAMSEIETAIQNNLLDQEINRLRKMDTAESRARADQLEAERKARDKLLQRVENEVGDPALRKGLAKFLATGAITEEVAALKRMGVPVEDFAAKIKQGKDVTDEFMDSLSKSGDATMRNIGTAALYDENTRKAFGVSTEFMNYLAKARDRDEKSQSDLIKDRIKRTKDDAQAQDPAQKARNALTEAEIAAKIKFDDLVASANPLLKNFDDMSLTVKALIFAAAAATAALGLLAAAATANAAKGALNTIRGRGGISGKTVDVATGTGGKLAKATKIGGGIAAVGMGAYEGYQAYKAGDKEGVGAAAGGTTGALVGGAIGSLLGPVGTVLGGMAGQYFGEKVGRWMASGGDKKDPKAGTVLSQAEIEEQKAIKSREKTALEQQVNDQSISDAERKLAEIKLRNIAKEEALLLNQEAINEYKAAKTPEEKAAAMAKSDRARATLAQLKTEEALYNLEKAKTDQERKDAQAALLRSREEAANVNIWRATQDLKIASNDEERKAAQAKLDAAKHELEQDQITIKKNEEIRKAEEELKKATTDEQKKIAEEKIKALKDGLQKELDAINKKYNVTEAKPKEEPTTGRTTGGGPPIFGGGLVQVVDVPVTQHAEGGNIPKGGVGLVGENGPEFITGPAKIENTKQFVDTVLAQARDKLEKSNDIKISKFSKTTTTGDISKIPKVEMPKIEIPKIGMPNFDLAKFAKIGNQSQASTVEEVTEDLEDISDNLLEQFKDTDKTVGKFDKELDDFVKNDTTGKMNKQLLLVTKSLEDFNELLNPDDLPTDLTATPAVQMPSTTGIAREVLRALIGRNVSSSGAPAVSGDSTGGGSSGGGVSSGGGTTSDSSTATTPPVATPAASSSGSKSTSGGGSSWLSRLFGRKDSKDSGQAEPAAPGAKGEEAAIPTAKPVTGDGEVQMGQEVRIGDEIRKGGTVSWRTNNPGNISYSGIAKKHGAIGAWKKLDGDQQQRTVGIAIMPSLEAGENLKMEQWRRPKYIDLTIDQGVAQWTGTTGLGSTYAKDLARAAGVDVNTVIGQLSDPQLRAMVDKQKVWEGFKEGQVLKAAQGGLFSGPSTGYPVEMHGSELVTRLNPNSLLERLAKTPAQQIEQELMQKKDSTVVTKTDDTMKEMVSINTAMMEMLADKLDNMIGKLDTSNETQEKLLKFSQA